MRSISIGASGLSFSLGREERSAVGLTATIRRGFADFRRRCFDRRSRQILKIAAARHVIENLLGQFPGFFLRGNFLEHWIFVQLLLNEISKLERIHLQHLDPLPQLRR